MKNSNLMSNLGFTDNTSHPYIMETKSFLKNHEKKYNDGDDKNLYDM